MTAKVIYIIFVVYIKFKNIVARHIIENEGSKEADTNLFFPLHSHYAKYNVIQEIRTTGIQEQSLWSNVQLTEHAL
jgi:hypothetical protein